MVYARVYSSLVFVMCICQGLAKDDQSNGTWSLYSNFATLEDKYAQASGLWWKARFAAQLNKALAANDTKGVTPAFTQQTQRTRDGIVLTAGSNDRFDLIMAFSGTSAPLEAVAAASGSSQSTKNVAFARYFLDNIEYASAPYDAFTSLTKDKLSLKWDNPRKPVNVLCTGAGPAASLVPLCGVWAAITYPQAHILIESFNSSWPAANAQFNWTMGQLVDQFYVWPEDMSKIGRGELTKYKDLNAALDKADETVSFNDADRVGADLFTAISMATEPMLIAQNGTDFTSLLDPQPGRNYTDAPVTIVDIAGAAYDSTQLNQTKEAWFEVQNECPLVLCKTRFPGFLSAMIYAEFDPNNPDAILPVPLDDIMKGEKYIRVKGSYDADGAVFYNATTDTAYFIFRGTESNKDWLADIKGIQRDWDNLEKFEARIWNEPEVADGFRDQFKAITYMGNAPDEDNLQFLLVNNLTDGRVPKHIVCTGQSLGGALSTLCAGYMSQYYYNSTVYTFNEGSPLTGNDDWVVFLRHNSGRLWRLVNEADQVPVLPPLSWYQHGYAGMWMVEGTLRLEQRPDIFELSNTNWDDHNYYLYSIIQNNIDNVTVPEWVPKL